MSSYTMQLKEYIEKWSQGEIKTTKERIEIGRPKLFDFSYPIFDEAYRNAFETHFIRTFYMREIGFETEALFKFHLETWLNINMPYFNKLFQSELIVFNPLHNTSVDTDSTRTTNKDQTQTNAVDGTVSTDVLQTNNTTQTVNDFERQIDSNNPDSRLSLTANDGVGVIEYASGIKENKETGTRTNNNTVDGLTTDTTNMDATMIDNTDVVETFVYSKTGKIGVQSFSKMLTEYRQALLRVETQIFNEMNQLFMLVY